MRKDSGKQIGYRENLFSVPDLLVLLFFFVFANLNTLRSSVRWFAQRYWSNARCNSLKVRSSDVPR